MGIGLIPFSPPADFATLNTHDSLRNETAQCDPNCILGCLTLFLSSWL
jgi:hypothetical protein